MKNNGWISLYRSIQNHGWYNKSSYVHLWLHILLKANHKNKKILWNGKELLIKKGSFITGRNELSRETGIKSTTIERILKTFENGHQIKQEKTNKFRLIKVINWNKFQNLEKKWTSNGHQTDTNNNDNNDNNIYTANADHYYSEKNMDTIYLDEFGEPIEQTTPKKYTNKKKLYSRIGVYYMNLLGKRGNVLRYFPEIKEMLQLYEQDFPGDGEEETEKEIKARIDIANKHYKSINCEDWGLRKVIENWDKIKSWGSKLK